MKKYRYLGAITIFCGIVFSVCFCNEIHANESLTRILQENRYSLFRNVNIYGNIIHVQSIGGIIAQKTQFPIYVQFNSSSNNRSPYVGFGWTLPFLESKFIRFSDNLYILYAPDGAVRYFVRDKNKHERLWGRNDWKADIKKEMIVVSKQDVKLTFKNGRLLQMQGRLYDLRFQYQGNVLEKIFDGAQCILQVEIERLPVPKTTLLMANNTKIELRMLERTHYFQSSAKKLRETTVTSLAQIEIPDFYTFDFKYSVDNMTCMLECSDGILSWDAKTGLAKRVNNKYYRITPPKTAACSAGIEENNKSGTAKVFWQKNNETGKEITERGGSRRIESYFISGILRGKKRKSERYYLDKLVESYTYTYDDKGRLIRVKGKDLEIIHLYQKDKLAATIQNENLKKVYTPDGEILAKRFLEQMKN